MLPQVPNDSSPFQSFDEARLAIEALEPMKSDLQTLARLGIDPVKKANTTILTHADIVRRFVPAALTKREDLDPGVLVCLEARDACRGWEIVAALGDHRLAFQCTGAAGQRCGGVPRLGRSAQGQ
jgi:hypothetical protein